MNAIHHSFINVNSQNLCIRTHVVTAGETGSTVVLLHGGGVDCASLSWDLLIPELAAHHRVIAFDWPGYGDSDVPRVTYSSAFLIQFLHDLLDTLGIQRASLAGISMGGMGALGFALRSPERVEKLVLVDSYGLQRAAAFHKLSYLFVKIPGMNALTWAMMRSRAMTRYTFKALLSRPGSLTEELLEQAYQQVIRPGAQTAWTSFQEDEMTWAGTKTCFLDRLNEITAPTLILHGTKDFAVPVDLARQAHERIRGSKLYWMEGCGHWPNRDNPEEFNRVVKEFLD